MPAQKREARIRADVAGITSSIFVRTKTWIAGTSPGMTASGSI